MSDSESRDPPGNVSQPDANAVIAAFGGIRPMATQMGLAVSTVQGWKMRNAIPENRWADVEAAARALGIDLTTLAKDEPSGRPSDAAPEDDATTGDGGEPSAEPEVAPDEAPRQAEEAEAEAHDDARARDLAQPEPPTGMDLPPLDGPRRGGTVVAWSALLIGVIALVAIVARPIWAPFVQPFVEPVVEAYLPKIEQTEPPAPAEPAVGEEEVAALAARIGGLETKTDNLIRLQEDITRLETRIQGLADRPAPESGAAAQDVVAITGSLTVLDEKLAALDGRLGQAESRLDDTVSNADFSERMAALGRILQTLSDNMETVRGLAASTGSTIDAIESDVNAVNARLNDIANRPVQSGARAAAVVLAVGQLDAAVMAGAPYQGVLEHLARLVGDDAGFAAPMATLAGNAAQGLPTRTELTRRFARLAPEATRTAKLEAAEGWLDKTVARVSGLVTVRRVDGEPTGPAAPVTKAERALSQDDLAAAVAALKGINGPVADWVADAGARLAAETALATLRGLAIDRLSAAEAQLSAEPAQ